MIQSGSNSKTALHYSFFDNFLHLPYGVSPNNHTNDDDDDDDADNYYSKRGGGTNNNQKEGGKREEENYLLSLLLPKYFTPEEIKSQSLEEFQRARLEQQLRVMRKDKKQKMDDGDNGRGYNEEEESKGGETTNNNDDNKKMFMADDDDFVNKFSDVFQKKRLEEQIKLRAQQKQQQQQQPEQQGHEMQQQQTINAVEDDTRSGNDKNTNIQQQEGHFLIANEAFQRALLEERLRQSQPQQQQKQQERFVIDMEAMEQDKNDMRHLIETTSASSSSTTTATMKKRDDDITNDDDVGNENDDVINDNIASSTTNNNSGGSNDDSGPPVNNDKVVKTDHEEEGGDGNLNAMSINGDGGAAGGGGGGKSATKATSAPSDLSTQLKSLHRMVALATAPVPPPPPSTNSAITLLSSNEETATSSSSRPPTRIQRFLATTHLPLPPSENTPIASLVIAPLAHIATSIFLSGAMIFYAVVAILDILLNDDKEEYCAKTCMRKAVSIWLSCWQYLFAKQQQQQQQQQQGAIRRTLEAAQTSFLALFYTSQCVVVRAAIRSKFATECMDAGIGSARYLIYATRSLNVIWKRVVSSLRRGMGTTNISCAVPTNTSIKIKKERRKFHLLRVLSNIRNSASRRINHQRSLLIKQQRMRVEKEFQDQVHTLNEDILAVELEKKKLEVDRANLLSEGVSLLAWYSMTKEASDALAAEREEHDKETRRKGGKRHWRPRFGYWAGLSRDDDLNTNDDENVETEVNNVTENEN